MTISHLRFGPEPIASSYLIEQADYLAVHHASYMQAGREGGGLRFSVVTDYLAVHHATYLYLGRGGEGLGFRSRR